MKSFTSVLKVLKPLACIVKDKDNNRVRRCYDDSDNADASSTDYSDADAYTTACSMDRKLTSCKCRDKGRYRCGHTRK